jgi:hypothetical protein
VTGSAEVQSLIAVTDTDQGRSVELQGAFVHVRKQG